MRNSEPLAAYRTVLMSGLRIAVTAALALLAIACSTGAGSTPTTQPTPATASKPAEPTKAPVAPTAPTGAPEAAKPTEALAKKVDYPAMGKTITLIIPFPTGGAADIATRGLVPNLEKELGVAVVLANKPGAGAQVGLTEVARSKPDGYTIGQTNIPTAITTYLDPERKAIYTRRSFQQVASFVVDPNVLVVRSDKPWKTLKDVLDAAKATPEKVKMAIGSGKLSTPHLGALMLENTARVKFANILFDGSGQALTTLLGGHADACIATGGTFAEQVRAGRLRVLGVMDKEESSFYPGVRTFEAQGYNVNMSVVMGYSVPAGTPREIVDILSAAVKKAMGDPELKKRMDSLALPLRYLDAAGFEARWTEMEKEVEPLMALVGQ